MKILCVIDSLGSGGAQRQMVNLACGLRAKGHDVELLIYFPKLNFFRSEIDSAGISVHEIKKGSRFSLKVVWHLIKLYRSGRFDAVVSFLDTPNFYAELAKLLTFSKLTLIVSERLSSEADDESVLKVIMRFFHSLANHVVANSSTHADWLRKRPWLKQKTQYIYNGYYIEPSVEVWPGKDKLGNLSLLVVGRITKQKNIPGILEGIIKFYQKHGDCPTVLLAGRQEEDAVSILERQKIDALLARNPVVASRWHFLGERRDVPVLLQQADALVHVSLYEGLPNAVCEAFIAARPVIASSVGDHPVLVEDGIRGVLCDPRSTDSICEAIERFVSLTAEERQRMGRNARSYAERHFSIGRMVSSYESLLLNSR